jgi:hypothetical protein
MKKMHKQKFGHPEGKLREDKFNVLKTDQQQRNASTTTNE